MDKNVKQRIDEVAKDRFHQLLAETNLPLRIAEIYKDQMAVVWQCEGEDNELREAESQKIIHMLMVTALSESLFLTTKQLFDKCSTLVRTGKPVNKSESRKLAEEFTKLVDGNFFTADGKGGSREKSKTFQTPQDCVEYFKKVRDLHPLWNYITDFFEKNDYASCDKLIRKDKKFIKLTEKCQSVPESLVRKIYERQNPQSKPLKPDLQPLGLALEHARSELGIDCVGHETLRKSYQDGKKLEVSAESQNS